MAEAMIWHPIKVKFQKRSLIAKKQLFIATCSNHKESYEVKNVTMWGAHKWVEIHIAMLHSIPFLGDDGMWYHRQGQKLVPWIKEES